MRSQAGITLLEVVLSIAILGIIAMIVFGLFTSSFNFSNHAREIRENSRIAGEYIERAAGEYQVNGFITTISSPTIAVDATACEYINGDFRCHQGVDLEEKVGALITVRVGDSASNAFVEFHRYMSDLHE